MAQVCDDPFPRKIHVTGSPATAAHIKRVLKVYLQRSGYKASALESVKLKAVAPGEKTTIEAPLIFGNKMKDVETSATGVAVAKKRITIINKAVPALAPVLLAFSNHPEKIKKSGLLYQAGLLKYKPLRLRYYHNVEKEDEPYYLGVFLLNNTKKPAKAHIIDAVGGPSANYMYAGHMNNLKFLHRKENNLGWIEEIPPQSAHMVRKILIKKGRVLSATADINLIEGGPLDVLVFAFKNSVENPQQHLLQTDKKDRHARGAYPLTRIKTDATFNLDDKRAFYTIADTPIGNIFKGKKIRGNYGITYEYNFTLKNPYAVKRSVTFLFQPRGGVATATFTIDGRVKSIGTTKAYQTADITRIAVPARSVKTVKIKTMPEDASNYPVRIILITDVE